MRRIEPVYQKFGCRVLAHRARCGMTQQCLADAVGLSRGSIANIELGRQRVPIHWVYIFAAAFRTSPQSMLRGCL